MTARTLACVFAALCVLLVGDPWRTKGVLARTVPPRTCEVCHKHSADQYQPYIRMLKFSNNTVCITNTFVKSDLGARICDSTGSAIFPEEMVAMNVETTDAPTCMICHEDASKVASMQKVWSNPDGSHCARAAFVENE